MANDKKDVRCSFCGRMQDEVKRLIAGPNAYICNECVQACSELLRDEIQYDEEGNLRVPETLPTPMEIKAFMDHYIIGQDEAKIALSVAVYNHYKRVCCDPSDGVEIEKSNVLLLGPTGSGKTTTLYSVINQLNDSKKKIITIEDPVEYKTPGLCQVQVNHKIGVTFAAGLTNLALDWIRNNDLTKISYSEYNYIAINGILLFCSYPLLYLIEKAFGFTSNITLIELSFPPLVLKKTS